MNILTYRANDRYNSGISMLYELGGSSEQCRHHPTCEPVSRRFPRPGQRRGDRDRSGGHRAHPRLPGRALPTQRAQPGRRGRSGHLPLVHRRRHGARCIAAGRQGRLVSQPLGPQRRCAQHSGGAGRNRAQPARRDAIARRQHQRAGSRRQDAGPGRRRRGQLRTHRRTRHRRAVRFRRHPVRRVCRSSASRPARPANCTRCPTPSRAANTCSTR